MLKLRDHSIAIIVLAAGRGTRMGVEPKLLLPLSDGRTILWHTVNNALKLEPCQLVVVVRPDLPAMLLALEHLPVSCVPNPRYTEGMATSLAAGIASLDENVEATLVLLGDEPSVSQPIVRKVVLAYAEERKPVTMPLYGDQPGPPTLFARAAFPSLIQLTGDTIGKQLLTEHPHWVRYVPLDRDEQPRDIDTPEDYHAENGRDRM